MATRAAPADPTRRWEILTGLVILGLFWGGLLAGELALRLFTQARFGITTTVERSEKFYIEPETGLRRIRPNVQMGQIRVNNMGFRGPDIVANKPAGTFRLAFLGASTTFNAEVPDGRTWPELTGRALQRAAGDSCRIEVINAGQPGYTMQRVRTLWTHHVAPLRPDLVLMMPGDVDSNLEKLAEAQGIPTAAPRPSWLARHSALMALLEKNFVTVRLQREALSRAGKISFDPASVAAPFEPALRDFVRVVAASGATVVLITPPSRLRASQSDEEKVEAGVTAVYFMPYVALDDLIAARDAYNAATRRVAGEEGAILVGDEDRIPADERHFVDSAHLSTAGSAVQAARVADALLASPRLREAARQAGCRFG
ncbi:MAG: SGNH/GDSL hydrolase family protein [Sphingomonadaceae bacterium]